MPDDFSTTMTSRFSQLPLDELLKVLPTLTSKEEMDACFTVLVEKLRPDILPLIAWKCQIKLAGTRERTMCDAEDALQELLIIIWQKAASFRGATPEKAKAWCCKIVVNWIINFAQKAIRREGFIDDVIKVCKNRERYNIAPDFAATVLDEIENGYHKKSVVHKLKKLFVDLSDF